MQMNSCFSHIIVRFIKFTVKYYSKIIDMKNMTNRTRAGMHHTWVAPKCKVVWCNVVYKTLPNCKVVRDIRYVSHQNYVTRFAVQGFWFQPFFFF